jgi:hypothetical protein
VKGKKRTNAKKAGSDLSPSVFSLIKKKITGYYRTEEAFCICPYHHEMHSSVALFKVVYFK